MGGLGLHRLAFYLILELSWQASNRQLTAGLVINHFVAQQMRFKADGQTLGAARETTELIERFFVGRNFWRQAVVFISYVIVKSLWMF